MNIFYDDHYNLCDAMVLCQPVVNWPGCLLPWPPSQLGMSRICSSGFAGSKVWPVFQASVDQLPDDPLTAD